MPCLPPPPPLPPSKMASQAVKSFIVNIQPFRRFMKYCSASGSEQPRQQRQRLQTPIASSFDPKSLSFYRKLVRGRAVTRWTESGTATTREQRPSAGGLTRTTTWWRLGRVRLVCQKARRETFKIGTLEVHLLELVAFLQVCTFKDNYMLYVFKF